MELYTQLQSRVFALETTKTNQALEIGSLKRKEIESSYEASLGDQEDASKHGRIIDNLDADKGVTLVDETKGRNDKDMFDTGVLDDEEVVAEKEVSTADTVNTTSKVVTTAGVEVSAAATTLIISMDDITLSKVLADLKTAKPMVKETSVPKAKRIVMQEPKETVIRTTTTVPSQSLKEKGKAKMIEPKKPLKKEDQIRIDEEVARNLEAQLQAKLEEEERLARQKEEEANIALIAKWDDVQAMMDADHELAERLQAEEQGELTIEERREEEKPPTKAQMRNQICTYLKNMASFTHYQLKNKSFKEVQKDFDNTMSWVNSFIPMDYKVVKDRAEGSETRAKGSSKRA
nr:hypothetical protein [Tanacetum cinerariifolium]